MSVSVAFADTVSVSDSKSAQNTENIQDFSNSNIDEQNLLIENSSGRLQSSRRMSSGSSVWVFIRMLLVLAIVIALIYLIFKVLKKNSVIPSDDDKFLRRVASVSVGQGKSVQIVTLIDSAYLIGVSDNSVNLISKVEDKKLIDAMNLYADKQGMNSKPKNFSDVLDLFMPAGRKKPDATFEDGASKQILDSLKKQSQRLDEVE